MDRAALDERIARLLADCLLSELRAEMAVKNESPIAGQATRAHARMGRAMTIPLTDSDRPAERHGCPGARVCGLTREHLALSAAEQAQYIADLARGRDTYRELLQRALGWHLAMAERDRLRAECGRLRGRVRGRGLAA